jgi:hypothetical protein
MPPALLAFLAPLVADIAPLDAGFQLNLYSLMGIAGGLIAILAFFRRTPPVDSQLVQLTASIQTLQATVEKLDDAKDKHSGHSQQITALEKRCADLESRCEREAASQRKYMLETSREFFLRVESESKVTQDKLDGITSTMQTVFLDMASQLGALKEAVKHGK